MSKFSVYVRNYTTNESMSVAASGCEYAYEMYHRMCAVADMSDDVYVALIDGETGEVLVDSEGWGDTE